MRKAITKIPLELLHQMLLLPDSVRITAARYEPMLGRVDLKLEGDGLPEKCEARDCQELVAVCASYKTEFNVVGDKVSFDFWSA